MKYKNVFRVNKFILEVTTWEISINKSIDTTTTLGCTL
jgi:hypothetical protein